MISADIKITEFRQEKILYNDPLSTSEFLPNYIYLGMRKQNNFYFNSSFLPVWNQNEVLGKFFDYSEFLYTEGK